ncbi:MAG: methyltransferase [Pseudomonas sp.]|nr:methyltransferase [Pseudomonas sp.]
MSHHAHDGLTALQAKESAQRLAFAPIAFQAARTMLQLNLLAELDQAGKQGLTAEQLAEKASLSEYAVKVLLDMGLSCHIVTFQAPRYYLAKVGYFLLHDDMTRVNMAFTDDVCYRAMTHLTASIQESRPAGLQELGDWSTIYEGLSVLPEPARRSWFEFDHYYSDKAFPELLRLVFAEPPQHLIDIGANTGRWASQCCSYDKQVQVTLVDLPQQLELAMQNMQEQGFCERVIAHPANLLESTDDLPDYGDVWWMSQFLDCFSPMQILQILRAIHAAMPGHALVYILEMFWDCQKFAAASYSLNATSLYFTCLANGNSRFYRSTELLELAAEAGFVLVEQTDDIGVGHTLLKLRKA